MCDPKSSQNLNPVLCDWKAQMPPATVTLDEYVFFVTVAFLLLQKHLLKTGCWSKSKSCRQESDKKGKDSWYLSCGRVEAMRGDKKCSKPCLWTSCIAWGERAWDPKVMALTASCISECAVAFQKASKAITCQVTILVFFFCGTGA